MTALEWIGDVLWSGPTPVASLRTSDWRTPTPESAWRWSVHGSGLRGLESRREDAAAAAERVVGELLRKDGEA